MTHLDVSENSIEKLDVSALQELKSARCARNSLTELIMCGRNLVSLIAGHNSKPSNKLLSSILINKILKIVLIII